MPDNLRSSHEDKLISLSKQYQSAYVSKDLNKLDELFSPKVVYHADKVRPMASACMRMQPPRMLVKDAILPRST